MFAQIARVNIGTTSGQGAPLKGMRSTSVGHKAYWANARTTVRTLIGAVARYDPGMNHSRRNRPEKTTGTTNPMRPPTMAALFNESLRSFVCDITVRWR
jgi:hypothetical protein